MSNRESATPTITLDALKTALAGEAMPFLCLAVIDDCQ